MSCSKKDFSINEKELTAWMKSIFAGTSSSSRIMYFRVNAVKQFHKHVGDEEFLKFLEKNEVYIHGRGSKRYIKKIQKLYVQNKPSKEKSR